MLPKKERLKRIDFSRFFSVGRRVNTPLFQLIYSEYPSLHVSVVVSKKVSKLAVKRNKIRRRVYDVVRTYRKEAKTTGVYIFIMKAEAAGASYEEIRDVAQTAIKKLVSI